MAVSFSAVALLFAAPTVAAPFRSATGESPPPGEVDALMERVFESRRAAWRRLGDFDLRETATWRIGRAGEPPVAASRVEYRWTVRDGVALQSPVAVDGVPVGDRHRRAYERRFRHDERRRREGRDGRPRPLGREDFEDRVDEILESEWGITAGRGLRRRLVGDALLLGDTAAAVALYTGDLLEERGGVAAVGFAEALARTEALLRMGEQGRLSAGEAGRALRRPLGALSDSLDLDGAAGPDEAARFLDLALRASLLGSDGESGPAGGESGLAGAGRPAVESRGGNAASAAEADLVRVREWLAAPADSGGANSDFFPGHGVRLDPHRVEPRFVVDHHYYTDWTFEPGRFYLVGREAVAGGEALRIEYYPLDAREGAAGEQGGFGGEDFGDEDFVDRVVGSVHRRTLHTFRVDPETLDLVEHTVENGGLPGFPLRWLLRVDDFRAEMALAPLAEAGPLREIRMPKRVEIRGSLSTGLGDLEVVVTREFFDYRRTEPSDPIRPAPILPHPVWPEPVSPAPLPPAAETPGSPEVVPRSSSPAPGESPAATPDSGSAAEVQVFGNAALPDSEVLRLAGLESGKVLAPGSEEPVAARLRATGRFDRVAVRRRFRSLTPGREPTTVLWVEERRSASRGGRFSGSARGQRDSTRIPAPVLFPILNYDDGYGVTYGARLTAPDPVGERSRLSLPLSWGGLRRAALEFEVRPTRGPFSLVRAGVSASERENPHYLLRDRRTALAVGAERRIGERWRAVGEADWSRVRFGDRSERLGAYRLGLERDTRSDRLFPRSGAFLRAGWQGLRAEGRPVVHRPHLDARGFVGLFGRSVLAVRGRYEGASAPLPPYARPLLGGMDSVRGHRVGAEASDRLAAASVELRSPLNGPLEAHKWGVRLFYDFGAVAAAGEEFRRAPRRRGLGAGVFLRAPFLTLLLDAASDLEGGGRLHLSTTARF